MDLVNAWISAPYRDDPQAAEWAAYLEENCVWAADDFDYAGWDTAIPPRETWSAELEKFNAHLTGLADQLQ